jgi:hypothetical protein
MSDIIFLAEDYENPRELMKFLLEEILFFVSFEFVLTKIGQKILGKLLYE